MALVWAVGWRVVVTVAIMAAVLSSIPSLVTWMVGLASRFEGASAGALRQWFSSAAAMFVFLAIYLTVLLVCTTGIHLLWWTIQ